MTTGEIVLGVIIGLIVNEACDISPWAARQIVRWSARLRYRSPERAQIRAEELVALVEERPGKLLKLATSLWFLTTALATALHRVGTEVGGPLAKRIALYGQQLKYRALIALNRPKLHSTRRQSLEVERRALDVRQQLVTALADAGEHVPREMAEQLKTQLATLDATIHSVRQGRKGLERSLAINPLRRKPPTDEELDAITRRRAADNDLE